jgi:lipopolysaccharide/colanic/teichoic acid biosynthesis glycosyltransferase
MRFTESDHEQPHRPRTAPRYDNASVNDPRKRIFDVAGAAALLVLLSPVLAVVAAVVAVRMGRPVLFRQDRTGLDGEQFTILKFRTMVDATDVNGNSLADAQRVTSLGRFLRRTSLDELPELLNVVHGDMSLVGPRPLLNEYLPLYSEEQMRRHTVRPGITGWSQVNGRNALTWEEKFAFDLWYVDHRSLRLDLRILLTTIGDVMKGEGISHPGAATMEPFRGTESSSTSPTQARDRR